MEGSEVKRTKFTSRCQIASGLCRASVTAPSRDREMRLFRQSSEFIAYLFRNLESKVLQQFSIVFDRFSHLFSLK